ncbi:MAG: hypothetical protein A2X13_11930 [Bacteroidetes bacterium GWC2_33_15]|nr:MAG: hypothetical protein A2X10_05955 [Bacteroidetes bacterium GWA2_33_15]OFX50844.1 MAG: hypothetical protein A2X13_11930 [Bacteroidetes bacterium GWC2_33_15]OFX62873.1 MAG: hypothetical protein A2X15_09440 [Bacteroidetes bacterium GWB2_32_14]OFX69943.1 MAG: hypothetical protein A2X14_02300 [Bacteroidetes bacterium GWD2_33_33]HAN18935.1 hypothetical protein [Bacteroidales bacterium]
MKKIFFVILFLFPLLGFTQYSETHPDAYKSNLATRYKSDIIKYYNPLLDNYDIRFVTLDLNVSDQSISVSGNTILKAAVVVDDFDTLVLDFKDNMIIDSAIINGNKESVTHDNDEITYIFNPVLQQGDEITVQVFYHGTPTGGGVTNDYSSTWGKYVTWTLSESFHAYEWWPCKQVLSDKIDSVYLNFTCDDDCMVGSNGLLTSVVSLSENKKKFEWKSYYPMNYYMISFAVAEYQDYSIYANPSGSSPVLIQNFIYNRDGCLDSYKSQIDETANFIELYSEKFCLYPFSNEKYGHCLTELGGGMEHQTMTTLGSFGYTLVAHELAHQWFGDYVTCASWQDIWINEGFASYSEYIAIENLQSLPAAKTWMTNAHNYAFNEPSGSVYIAFEDAADETRIFNYYLSYKKGASIIHTIRHEINNDDLFYATLKEFLNRYKDSVATGEDFKNTLEDIASIDFDLFFEQWYYGKGFPTFNLGYSQTNDTLTFTVTQNTSSASTPLFNLFVDYKISYSTSDTIVRLYQDEKVQTFKIPIRGVVTSITVDPDNWILNMPGTVVSIENQIENEPALTLFPNPVKEILTISLRSKNETGEKQVQIYDNQGHLIYSLITHENEIPVNLSGLKTGIYFLKIISNGNSLSQKFLKL